MKTIDIKSPRQIKEEQKQREQEEAQKSVLNRSLIIKFVKWEYFPIVLPILAILLCVGIVYLHAWMTDVIYKEKVVSVVPTTFVRTAKAADAEELKPTYTIPQIVDAVHILESSGGVKDGCIAKGKINGFGFAQHGSGDVWNCYKNYAQVRTLVEQWFAEKVPAMGLPTALCYYNTGYQKADCPYYQNFLQVVKS